MTRKFLVLIILSIQSMAFATPEELFETALKSVHTQRVRALLTAATTVDLHRTEAKFTELRVLIHACELVTREGRPPWVCLRARTQMARQGLVFLDSTAISRYESQCVQSAAKALRLEDLPADTILAELPADCRGAVETRKRILLYKMGS